MTEPYNVFEIVMTVMVGLVFIALIGTLYLRCEHQADRESECIQHGGDPKACQDAFPLAAPASH